MSLLQCSHCEQGISATHKQCPHCGTPISFWREVKSAVEKSRLRQVGVVILVMFLLGTSWYIGKNTGYRWPLFAMVILCAPVVPWLLQLAYKSAAPITEEADTSSQNATGAPTDTSVDEDKYWKG